MANTLIQLNIVSLEASIFSGLVELVVVTATTGELGIMAGHVPLLASIQAGQIRITTEKQYSVYYTSGGILEVQPDLITILADTVVRAEDLDDVSAAEARAGAKGILANKKTNSDFAEALAQISHVTAKLKTIQFNHRYNKNR